MIHPGTQQKSPVIRHKIRTVVYISRIAGPRLGHYRRRLVLNIQERGVGAAKGMAADLLRLGDAIVGGNGNTVAARLAEKLSPATKDEKFGADIAGIFVVLLGPEKEAADLTLLKKSLASEGQVAEIMAGGIRPIAGAGSTELRDAPRLAATYGGKAEDWAKITSGSFKAADGTNLQLHAYQNVRRGQVVELGTVLSK